MIQTVLFFIYFLFYNFKYIQIVHVYTFLCYNTVLDYVSG